MLDELTSFTGVALVMGKPRTIHFGHGNFNIEGVSLEEVRQLLRILKDAAENRHPALIEQFIGGSAFMMMRPAASEPDQAYVDGLVQTEEVSPTAATEPAPKPVEKPAEKLTRVAARRSAPLPEAKAEPVKTRFDIETELASESTVISPEAAAAIRAEARRGAEERALAAESARVEPAPEVKSNVVSMIAAGKDVLRKSSPPPSIEETKEPEPAKPVVVHRDAGITKFMLDPNNLPSDITDAKAMRGVVLYFHKKMGGKKVEDPKAMADRIEQELIRVKAQLPMVAKFGDTLRARIEGAIDILDDD